MISTCASIEKIASKSNISGQWCYTSSTINRDNQYSLSVSDDWIDSKILTKFALKTSAIPFSFSLDENDTLLEKIMMIARSQYETLVKEDKIPVTYTFDDLKESTLIDSNTNFIFTPSELFGVSLVAKLDVDTTKDTASSLKHKPVIIAVDSEENETKLTRDQQNKIFTEMFNDAESTGDNRYKIKIGITVTTTSKLEGTKMIKHTKVKGTDIISIDRENYRLTYNIKYMKIKLDLPKETELLPACDN